MKRHILFFLLYCLIFQFIHAQKERNIWYFGLAAGVDFNSGSPVALTNGAMQTYEGCATISDKNGKLLFYTDGVSVWDATHQVMSNGSGLLGAASSTQSCIIVPDPADDQRYYIFTMDHVPGSTIPIIGNGLNYNVVDMRMNGGRGNVVTKNVPLLTGIRLTEKLTGIMNDGGNGYWVLCHELDSDAFYAYEVTSSGVNSTPVVSHAGSVYNGSGSYLTWQYQGYLKASPDGLLLASGISNNANPLLEILDFDNVTGVVSNGRTLSTTDQVYGVEFSPNAQYLYTCGFSGGLYQYDLFAGSPAAISAGKKLINNSISGTLQLGPDNKIYLTGDYYLHRIDQPNIPFPGCNLQWHAVDLLGRQAKFGLPNFLPRIQHPFITYQDTCLGNPTLLSFNDTDNVVNVLWDFGDPNSGAANQSVLVHPSHIFTDTGSYIITAIVNFIAFGKTYRDTVVDTLYILAPPNPLLPGDTTICPGDTLVLDVTWPRSTYLWKFSVKQPVNRIHQPGNYWVKVTNACMSVYDTIHVDTLSPPQQPHFYGDTIICKGTVFRAEAFHPGLTYTWQDNSVQSFYYVDKEGKYWVEWKDVCNRTVSDTFLVEQQEDLLVDLGKDTLLCFGDQLELDATDPSVTSYLWQDSSLESTFLAAGAGIYWVKLTNKCETAVDTIKLDLLFPPGVYLGEDTTLCRNSSLLLDAGNEGLSYLWQDGSDGRYNWARKEGNYWVNVTNECALISDSLEAMFTYPPRPELGNDTLICSNAPLKLDVYHDDASYHWQDGSEQAYFVVNSSGTYAVEVTNACGKKVDSVKVRAEYCSCKFYVPNTFTPDQDGVNDIFNVYHDCELIDFRLEIFTRWGDKVYESNSPSYGWDGTFQGKQMPDEAYIWVISYNALEGNVVNGYKERGQIYLLR